MRVTAVWGVVLVAALAASTRGAVLKITDSALMPANSVFVRFEGLKSPSSGGQPLSNYTEQGVYFDSTSYGVGAYFTPATPTGTNLCTPLFESAGNYVIFPVPQTKVGWREFYDSAPSVTLWADAEGTQLIGTFDIAIAFNGAVPRFHGFESDTPFRRMSLTPPIDTIWVDDLQFVPEPGTGLIVLVGAVGILTLRRRARS